jgi:choline dehydrogenase-like flavoprotein
MFGLRVADASIMPRIVSANTNAASMMIGWKAGEIIMGETREEGHTAHPDHAPAAVASITESAR